MCKKNLSNLSLFAHEESKHSFKPCRFLASSVRDAFSHCNIFSGISPSSSQADEYLDSYIDDEQDVVVQEIQSRAMEAKLRHRSRLMTGSHCCVFSPKEVEYVEENKDEEDEDAETFFSVGSCFSRCSSTCGEVFLSVGSCFSHRSSISGLDFGDVWRRSIIQEFCYCRGWPFGLWRKAVLFPPLPTSPSESWLWRRDKVVRIA